MKKCRARYGLDQQNQWCKPCRYDTQLQDPLKHTHTYTKKSLYLVFLLLFKQTFMKSFEGFNQIDLI